MNIYLMVSVLGLVPVCVALAMLYRRLATRPEVDFASDGLPVLAPGKYRPMERLLQEEDFRFLAAQRGYRPSLGRRLRTERRRIFRGYLRNLSRDFGKLSAACQMLMVHAAEDRPELAASLMKQRVFFGLGMLAVEGRLLLHAVGVGTVDVRDLVASLETMQSQIQILLAPPQAASAAI